MKEKNTCIFCDSIASSKEHIFPAAFGGKITNSKIYCEKHNNELGHYVAYLENHCSIFNSMLGVVADRKKTTKDTIVENEDGSYYKINMNNVQTSTPPLLTKKDIAQQLNLKFSSKNEAKEWLEQNMNRGYSYDRSIQDILQSTKLNLVYSTKPIKIRLQFGDLCALKAILYLTITNLTHKKPEIIRNSNLDKIKSLLLDEDTEYETIVNWNGHDILNYVPQSTSMFSHLFRFILTKKWGCYAQVSLFSTFNFFVNLGQLAIETDEELIFDINPLCKTYEQLNYFSQSKEFRERDIDSITEIIPLKEMISKNYMNELLNRFTRNIENYQNNLSANILLNDLKMDVNNSNKVIEQFVIDYSQGFLNTFLKLNENIKAVRLEELIVSYKKDNKIINIDRINIICKKFHETITIKEDNSQPNNLDINSQTTLNNLIEYSSEQIKKIYQDGDLSVSSIESFLNKSALVPFFKNYYISNLRGSFRHTISKCTPQIVSYVSKKIIPPTHFIYKNDFIKQRTNSYIEDLLEKEIKDYEDNVIPIIIDTLIDLLFDTKR